MTTFLHCKGCGREYLGSAMEVEDFQYCRRCDPVRECGICFDLFIPTPYVTIAGVRVEYQTAYCEPCYARECVSLDEEVELNAERHG